MAITVLNLSDEVFWNSSLRFICKQIDFYVEQNGNNKNNKASTYCPKEEEEYKIKKVDW